MKIGLEDGKKEKLQLGLTADRIAREVDEPYQLIVLAIDQVDLDLWAKEVATGRAERDLIDQQVLRRSNTPSSNSNRFLNKFFSRNTPITPTSGVQIDLLAEEAQKDLLEQVEREAEAELVQMGNLLLSS